MLKAHVGRITEDCPEHQGVVVYSMNDTPLGFGVTARSTAETRKLDPTGIVVFRQADIGEYLRDVSFPGVRNGLGWVLTVGIGRYTFLEKGWIEEVEGIEGGGRTQGWVSKWVVVFSGFVMAFIGSKSVPIPSISLFLTILM